MEGIGHRIMPRKINQCSKLKLAILITRIRYLIIIEMNLML